MTLKNRHLVVTGGARGIGRAVVEAFLREGAKVTVLDIDAAGMRDLARPQQCWPLECDVREEQQVLQRMRDAAEAMGGVDGVVNSAGVANGLPFEDTDYASWKAQIETNLNGPFNTTKAFLAPLKATRGAIINIGSIAATVYTGNTVGYSASKGGVHMLTVALARELGKDGVRVNTVAPGAIATPMSPSAGDETRMANLMRRVPLGRIGQPEDLVGPVVFLASPLAAYVTGATLRADGGYLTN